jgi:hypothetical protein
VTITDFRLPTDVQRELNTTHSITNGLGYHELKVIPGDGANSWVSVAEPGELNDLTNSEPAEISRVYVIGKGQPVTNLPRGHWVITGPGIANVWSPYGPGHGIPIQPGQGVSLHWRETSSAPRVLIHVRRLGSPA